MPVDCEHSWYLAYVRLLGFQHPELQPSEPLLPVAFAVPPDEVVAGYLPELSGLQPE